MNIVLAIEKEKGKDKKKWRFSASVTELRFLPQPLDWRVSHLSPKKIDSALSVESDSFVESLDLFLHPADLVIWAGLSN